MLKPATCYKREIQREVAKKYYSEEMFYFTGYRNSSNITVEDEYDAGHYQWASVDNEGNLCGFIGYRIDFFEEAAYSFRIMSFMDGLNLIIAKDLNDVMEKLLTDYNIHRIEWRAIEGNPAIKAYDRFIKKYGGRRLELHDAVKDVYGNYHDEYIYEILKGGKLSRRRALKCADMPTLQGATW